MERLAWQIRETGMVLKIECCLFVIVQWRGEGEYLHAVRLARALGERARTVNGEVQVVAMVLRSRRKRDSINAILFETRQWRPVAVGWLDDDIVLERQCILTLINSLLQTPELLAVGAKKIGIPSRSAAARLVYAVKKRTAPAINYPHGCCIVVRREALGDGIPFRYVSDDGYLLFRCLKMNGDNPLSALKVHDKALCYHRVGKLGLRANVRRIRRMLINHLVFISDYPMEKGLWYLRESLFWGLWPISTSARGSRRLSSVVQWVLKALHFVWFLSTAAELIIRGLIRKPLREIPW